MFNIREIKELINLMNQNELTEIEVEAEGTKIKLKKGPDGVVVQEPKLAAALPQHVAAPAPSAPSEPAKEEGQTIKSPMVGTFYASPAPDADAYVKAGSKIEVGKVVCIVEAMKLMNEIKSEIKGTISKIHVNNGDPVEFGQPLFTVTP